MAWAELPSDQEPRDAENPVRYDRQAVSLAEELGMRPPTAHCHLGLGKLYRRAGKREQAQDHLTAASSMFREMDMQIWLEQAEAELKALA